MPRVPRLCNYAVSNRDGSGLPGETGCSLKSITRRCSTLCNVAVPRVCRNLTGTRRMAERLVEPCSRNYSCSISLPSLSIVDYFALDLRLTVDFSHQLLDVSNFPSLLRVIHSLHRPICLLYRAEQATSRVLAIQSGSVERPGSSSENSLNPPKRGGQVLSLQVYRKVLPVVISSFSRA